MSTRQRIVNAAAASFMQQGYAATGLKQLAADSEATIGSLYHFFPGGKEELAAETLRTAGASYQRLVESVFDSAPNLVRGVAWCFIGAARTLEATDYADACPIATVALEVASTDDGLRQVTHEVFELWLGSAGVRLRAAGVRPKRAKQLATTLVAALEGGFLLSRAAKDTGPMLAIGQVMTELVRAELGQPSTASDRAGQTSRAH